VEVVDYQKFKKFDKNNKKKQIILVHTSRNANDYLLSLQHRFNGKYKKIPHYLINREGVILQLLSNKEVSNFFGDNSIDKNVIIISLENMGWLEKEPLFNHYVNWIGDIYKDKVYDKKWRDYFFWQPYTDEQMESLVYLCKRLFKEMSIKNAIVGHNTKINGIEKFEGVVSRSNYDSEVTDLNPSFDFELFIKKIEDEKYT